MDRKEIEATKVEIARKRSNGEKLTRVEEVVEAFEVTAAGCHACGGSGDNGVTIAVRRGK